MLISAIVCTYNRCESLRDTLRSLDRQLLPHDMTFEIVVVDNGSVDRTNDVVQEAAREGHWLINYVMEPRLGIAFARNTGLRTARGTYVAFVDDDAVAGPGWVAAIVRAFEETGADMVGGRVTPLWLTSRPSWLSEDLMGPIMSSEHGPVRKRCTTETFLTTNCALKRVSLAQFGMFDESLGRRGERWVGGEDLELCQRWLRLGAVVLYEPTAVVEHKVSPQRVTPEFYRRWFEDIGYTQAHQLDWKWHYSFSIVPVWRWGKLLYAGARFGWTRVVPSNETSRLRAEMWWRFQRSFLRERVDHYRRKTPCHFSQT